MQFQNSRSHGNIEESPSECENEYSFRIDDIVEDRQESLPECQKTVSELTMLWKTPKFKNEYSVRVDNVMEHRQEFPFRIQE